MMGESSEFRQLGGSVCNSWMFNFWQFRCIFYVWPLFVICTRFFFQAMRNALVHIV